MIVRKKIILNSNDPAFHLELVLPRWLGRRLTISKLMICHKKSLGCGKLISEAIREMEGSAERTDEQEINV